jgi:hypothetical protein
MPSVHITSTDPLGLGSDGVINVKSITPSTPRSYSEVLLSSGKYKADALKVLKPLEQFEIVFELLDTASLVLPFGIAVNTDYIITGASCACGPDKYPLVTVTCIKPTNITMLKASSAGVTLTCVGGFGIVNKWGATAAEAFISSNCSVTMTALDSMDETSGDFLVGGLYYFGFKQEMSFEAYGAITAPAGAHASPNAPTTPKETAEGWQIYPASFWQYLDPAA